MTLDEGYVSTSELMRRTEEQEDREQDREQYRREREERDETESIEAEEQKWIGIRRAMPQHVRDIHYDSGPG